jgi:hypothetical protein
MKINAIGIDAYRQATETQTGRKPMTSQDTARTGDTEKIQIPGQGNTVSSKLSVRLKSGTFLDQLSGEEKKALELLFDKFRQMGVNEASYRKDGSTEQANLGNVIDVKL